MNNVSSTDDGSKPKGGRPRKGTARRQPDRRWQLGVTVTLPSGKPRRVFAVIPGSAPWSDQTARARCRGCRATTTSLVLCETGSARPPQQANTAKPGDPTGNRTRVADVRGRCPNR